MMMRRLAASIATLALMVQPVMAAPQGQSTQPQLPLGTTPGTAAAGNDSRITGAVQQGGDVSVNPVNGRALSVQFKDRINIKDKIYAGGAYGDYKSRYAQVTIGAGSTGLFVAGAAFSQADVGKRLILDGAGPARASDNVITPLSTTIVSVADTQNIALNDPATTGLASVSVEVGWGHEDTAPFNSAIAAACSQFSSGGVAPAIYAPGSTYLLGSTATVTTAYHCPIQVVGDTQGGTQFKIDPALAGGLFSVSEDWLGYAVGSFNNASPSGPSDYSWAPTFRNFTVLGDSSAPAEQDGVVLYDRNDRVTIENVIGSHLYGSLTRTGVTLKTIQSYLRESAWRSVYCYYCGIPGGTVFDFNSVGTSAGADTTNTNTFDDLQAWQARSYCISVRGQQPTSNKSTTYLNFTNARCESSGGVQIGDGVSTGRVSQINFYGLRVLNIPVGGYGVTFAAPTVSSAPFGVHFTDTVLDGPGNGINIQASVGATTFKGVTNTVSGTKLTVGASTLITGPIEIDAQGQETAWTKSIDNSSLSLVMYPMRYSANGGVFSAYHDGSAGAGNSIGSNSVDLSTSRTSNTQVAAANQSEVLGGSRNTVNASGTYAAVLSGSDNTLNGPYSSASGKSTADRSRFGMGYIYASANLRVPGDAQNVGTIIMSGTAVLSLTQTTILRVTTDRAVASSINTDNISAGFHFAMDSVSAMCQDYDATGHAWARWYSAPADLDYKSDLTYSGAFSASTNNPAVSVGALSGTATSLKIAADASLLGLNASFTLPVGSTADRVDCYVTIRGQQEGQ